MTTITKQALIERGFEPRGEQWMQKVKDEIGIMVHADGEMHVFEGRKTVFVQVKNCRTLEQLDSLIEVVLG